MPPNTSNSWRERKRKTKKQKRTVHSRHWRTFRYTNPYPYVCVYASIVYMHAKLRTLVHSFGKRPTSAYKLSCLIQMNVSVCLYVCDPHWPSNLRCCCCECGRLHNGTKYAPELYFTFFSCNFSSFFFLLISNFIYLLLFSFLFFLW